MRIGQLQGALMSVVGLREIEPSIAALQSLPLLFRNWDEVDHVREKMRPAMEQRFLARGFVVVGWGDAGWVRFFSKDAAVRDVYKRQPAPLEAIASRGRSTLDLEALSARKTAVDRAPANGSSIAVLLEHKGVSVLLGADAYPTVLVPALKALAAHRGETLPLRVDVFKLSHHGSRANVTIDLLKAVQAQHYIVSTNGSIFGHPDDEAIARVILGGGDKPVLWFNYSTARTDKWAASDIQKRFKFEAHVPNDDSRGARLEIEP